MATTRVKVSQSGRLSLPIEVRRELGIERGGTLLLEAVDGEIRLTTLKERVRRVQALARELLKGQDVSSEEIISERRREVARELAEQDRGFGKNGDLGVDGR